MPMSEPPWRMRNLTFPLPALVFRKPLASWVASGATDVEPLSVIVVFACAAAGTASSDENKCGCQDGFAHGSSCFTRSVPWEVGLQSGDTHGRGPCERTLAHPQRAGSERVCSRGEKNVSRPVATGDGSAFHQNFSASSHVARAIPASVRAMRTTLLAILAVAALWLPAAPGEAHAVISTRRHASTGRAPTSSSSAASRWPRTAPAASCTARSAPTGARTSMRRSS